NCATCHGLEAQGTENGPSLIGVGAASVDFQVGTGRMPMQMNGPQAYKKPAQFNDTQTHQLSAYVASLGAGPAIPAEEYLDEKGDAAKGGELFRTNCAMCHNAAAAGGALTRGKFAPALADVSGKHIYEAMATGPQNMPVFSDSNVTPEGKRDIITFLKQIEANGSPGGADLGALGPVSEGLFVWIAGLGVIIAFTIWLTSRTS
ncbi:MAG TPA: c-type cytochrome, partial [Arthrobacter sp.]|nr:c-type cytochrome [Arthrobacter sp.]